MRCAKTKHQNFLLGRSEEIGDKEICLVYFGASLENSAQQVWYERAQQYTILLYCNYLGLTIAVGSVECSGRQNINSQVDKI